MRVALRERMPGVSWRFRPINWLAMAEKLLIALALVQIVRLVWTVATPVGSYGQWQGRQAQVMAPNARAALFAAFDPFYRGDGAAPAAGQTVVTSLALTLYGIRLNEGSGLGSAIIAGPDGVQNSIAVGEEVMPGVVLKAVAFDHVVIDRGGTSEQLFLDQSGPAPTAAPATPTVAPTSGSAAPPTLVLPAPPPPGKEPSAQDLQRDIGFAPRTDGGRITGLAVSARGPAFAAAGFQPGDIVTQVNGRQVSDLQTLQRQFAAGAPLSLSVERGASIVTINLTPQGR